MIDEFHPNLLTKSEVSKLLKCSERTIDKWRKSEGMPYIKLGRYIRFELEAVLAWMQNHVMNKEAAALRKLAVEAGEFNRFFD